MSASSKQLSTAGSLRLEPRPGELIDRERLISFTFNGQILLAHPGDTVASALAANGIRVIARSFKYHRPRGLFAYGHSMNSLVQIGDEVSESVWLGPVKDGLVVDPVNVWPSLERDAMSLTALGDRFLPVGFYYKTFIRPVRLWPVYEKVLRRAAGLGRVNTNAGAARGFSKQYLHFDVVVVGGGPAGLRAALAAAERGVKVALLDENSVLGGHLAYAGVENDQKETLVRSVMDQPGITVFKDTLVAGYFEHRWLFAVRAERLYKIRAGAIIFATGAEDQPPIFDNNDLPGVMMISAVQRLISLYGAAPGRRVVISTASDDGWHLGRLLVQAGVEIVAMADLRPVSDSQIDGVVSFARSAVIAAEGKTGVEWAIVAEIDADGQIVAGTQKRIDCDVIAVGTHWAPRYDLPYLAGVTYAFNPERHEFMLEETPAGIWVAGRAAGSADLENDFLEGETAGWEAAEFIKTGLDPHPDKIAAQKQRRQAGPQRSSGCFIFKNRPGGKRFVDLDEDVTDKDVADAIAEGYSSIELLKRYSTISMGPSQGKWSSINTIYLTAKLTGRSISDTGKTTSRPPVRPVKMGQLAGQMLEPVRRTPLHAWHVAHGAKMMVSGLWLRAEHYGDPTAEVMAVRNQVGLIDISTLGKIKLCGPGVGAFLDKIYTNRFSNLKVGRVRYGLMCTPEGIIMDDGVTARLSENEWYMTTTSAGAGRVFEWLQWWLQSGWGDGVQAVSVGEGRAAFNLAGPHSRSVLSKISLADLSDDAFSYMRVREIDLAGVSCRLMRIGFTGELSYEIHVPASRAIGIWEAVMSAGREYEILAFGVEAQRVLRLEKGHVIIGQDTDALTDALSADLAWVVNFKKEEFLGRRSITRVNEHGIRQRLVGFKMADRMTVPEEGLQIVEQVHPSECHPIGLKIIGWVTSSRYSPTLGEPIGLCWLPADLAAEAGRPFKIRRNGQLVEGITFHGPFVDAKGSRLKG